MSSLPTMLAELVADELVACSIVRSSGAGLGATSPACCAAAGDGTTVAAAEAAWVTAGVAAFATVFSTPVTGPAALAGAASAAKAIDIARKAGNGNALLRRRPSVCRLAMTRRRDAVGC